MSNSDEAKAPGTSEAGDVDLPWDARIRQLVDFGVDETLIAENLRRTPTERLQRMMDMVRFIEENRARQGQGR